jgi:endonuclease YncB( thermonuclease family)
MDRRAVRLLVSAFLCALAGSAPAARKAADQPDPKLLVGVWEGTVTKVATGQCRSADGTRDIRVVFRIDDDGKVKAGITFLPAVVDLDDNATVRVEKQKIFVDKRMTATCGENFTRKYVVKLELGASVEADGTRKLRLAGMDVPCIQMGCRFQDLYDLTYKGAPK